MRAINPARELFHALAWPFSRHTTLPAPPAPQPLCRRRIIDCISRALAPLQDPPPLPDVLYLARS
jgi:hypothetical protein